MAIVRKRGPITPFRVLLGPLVALIAIGWITSKPANPVLRAAPGGPNVTIWLVDNGFHTDLAVSRAAVIAHGGPSAEAARAIPARTWLLIGWGDESFYTHSGFSAARVGDGLRALFAPDNPSVVHLDAFDARPDRAFVSGVVPIQVSPQGLEAMLLRLDRSFAPPVRPFAHWSASDGFFHSRETFSLAHLCDHWTGEMLNAAGLANIPMLDTAPGGLRFSLRLRGFPNPTPHTPPLDAPAPRP